MDYHDPVIMRGLGVSHSHHTGSMHIVQKYMKDVSLDTNHLMILITDFIK